MSAKFNVDVWFRRKVGSYSATMIGQCVIILAKASPNQEQIPPEAPTTKPHGEKTAVHKFAAAPATMEAKAANGQP